MKITPFPGNIERKFILHEFITKTGKTGCQKNKTVVLNPEQISWLQKWFPVTENSRLVELTGMSASTLHRFARELKLTKTDKGMAGIWKRTAAKIKRECRKNGYYANIKGKKPSEECREGARRMWQEIREGKRMSPLAIMKEKNPRKFRRFLEKRSASRKEAYRQETLRIIYGLRRKTRYNIVINKYTKRQLSHRYNALQRDYFVMKDCSEKGGERYNIYYDETTKRSEKFERNLISDGFNVLRWQERN